MQRIFCRSMKIVYVKLIEYLFFEWLSAVAGLSSAVIAQTVCIHFVLRRANFIDHLIKRLLFSCFHL